MYDGEENYASQPHVDSFNDFIDIEEVNYDDAKMILFAQSLSGETKKWFKSLPARSIPSYDEFETCFLDKWEDKKNPFVNIETI